MFYTCIKYLFNSFSYIQFIGRNDSAAVGKLTKQKGCTWLLSALVCSEVQDRSKTKTRRVGTVLVDNTLVNGGTWFRVINPQDLVGWLIPTSGVSFLSGQTRKSPQNGILVLVSNISPIQNLGLERRVRARFGIFAFPSP